MSNNNQRGSKTITGEDTLEVDELNIVVASGYFLQLSRSGTNLLEAKYGPHQHDRADTQFSEAYRRHRKMFVSSQRERPHTHPQREGWKRNENTRRTSHAEPRWPAKHQA